MSAPNIPDGDYAGLIEEYAFINMNDRDWATIKVKILLSGQAPLMMTWWGSLGSEKSKAFILKTFRALNPDIKDWKDLQEGIGLRRGTEVKVVIENIFDVKSNMTRTKIKYLNPAKNYRVLDLKNIPFSPDMKDDNEIPF